jgi:hypothetical protein
MTVKPRPLSCLYARGGRRRSKNGDLDQAKRALSQARGIDEQVSSFQGTLTADQETARFSPHRRGGARASPALRRRGGPARLVSSRRAKRGPGGVGHGSPASGPLSEAVLDLARAIQAPADYLEKPSDPKDARRFILDAAGKATTALKDHEGDLVTSVSVGQIRTTAVNLLISTGMDQTQALQALEEAAGSASDIG